MAKHYHRKTLSNLDELDLEQTKIRKAYHSMEHHFLESLFQPEKIAFTLGSRLVKGLVSKKKNTTAPGSAKGFFAARYPAIGPGRNLFQKMVCSLVRLQIFNLGFFLGRSVMKGLRQKRKLKRARS